MKTDGGSLRVERETKVPKKKVKETSERRECGEEMQKGCESVRGKRD